MIRLNAIISAITVANICAVSAQNHGQPNIIVFIADDAGMDFGCYGNKGISTPNIDMLAASGMRFEKAFLTSPQSSPSRTSMMTGMFAHTIGTQQLHAGIDEETLMMPHYFKQAGYFAASLLKTHWGENGDRQFDKQIGGPVNDNFWTNYQNLLDENLKKPFFLWVGFNDPHRPYNRETINRINSIENVTIPPYLIDGPDTRRDLADYYDEISRMDGDIARMLGELEKRNLMHNTIIVFLSDNGMPFPRAKGTLYDSGIQTPLIFVWKDKIKPETVHNNGLISTIDLAPTLLDLAGIDIPENMYGRGFKEILFDHSKRGREYIFAERNWHNTDEYMRCVRTEKFKLIYNAFYSIPHGTPIDLSTSPSWYELKRNQRDGTLKPEQNQIFVAPRAMVEIFDLENDPDELYNVADRADFLNTGRILARELERWQNQTNDYPWHKNRRSDQSCRITGFPLFSTRPPLID